MHGRCYRRDCRRSCHLDYQQLIRDGLGAIPVHRLAQTYKCNRIEGCMLEFQERPDRVVILSELTGRDYVGAEIRCGICRATYITSVEGLILRLTQANQGGAETPIKNVGKLIRGPCGKCKVARWDVQFLWYDPASKVPLWKQDLLKRRDQAQRKREMELGPPR